MKTSRIQLQVCWDFQCSYSCDLHEARWTWFYFGDNTINEVSGHVKPQEGDSLMRQAVSPIRSLLHPFRHLLTAAFSSIGTILSRRSTSYIGKVIATVQLLDFRLPNTTRVERSLSTFSIPIALVTTCVTFIILIRYSHSIYSLLHQTYTVCIPTILLTDSSIHKGKELLY